MKSQFRTILKLEVFHSYYRNRKCIDLSFLPSYNTHQLFQRFGFVLRAFGHGFLLLSDSENYIHLATYIDEMTGGQDFEINASATDPNFYLFTSYPANQLGYFSYNIGESSGEEPNPALLLPAFQETTSTERQLQIKIDPKALTNHETSMRIELEARRSQWEYLVINQSKQTLGNLQILSKGKEVVTFVNEGETQLVNGVQAMKFTSEKTNLLTTNYTRYQLDLVQHQQTPTRKSATILYNGLPVPRPENLIVSSHDPALTSSLMYVYV